MTDSLLSQPQKSNRLDPPHNLSLASNDDEQPWMAFAGRDPKVAADQLDRQTNELLAYVQQQNDEIDERQAELNAKLAQLDNELRAARLRSNLDAGEDLLAVGQAEVEPVVAVVEQRERQHPEVVRTTVEQSVEPTGVEQTIVQTEVDATENRSEVRTAEVAQTIAGPQLVEPTEEVEAVAVREPQEAESDPITEPTQLATKKKTPDSDAEFEEVERIVAQFTDQIGPSDSAQPEQAEVVVDEQADQTVQQKLEQRLDEEKRVAEQKIRIDPPARRSVPQREATKETAHAAAPSRETVDAFPTMLTQSHLSRVDSGVDIQAMASSLDASELESERRLLAERKIELDRRKSVLQRMQDETQALHREALEMRLVTEQLWIELSDKAPAEHVNELLSSLRARLDEHYTAQQGVVDGRKAELVELQQLIESKQDDIREQSQRLQSWVEVRHDEIKSYAAEVDAREMLLDRREHRLNEEFSKWEAQRGAYQQQLQGLLKKLNLAGLGD